jgi:uncharacterized protein (TIGR02246 family)
MVMKRFGVVIVAVASFVAGCSGARTDAGASSEADRAAVEKTTAAFHDALRSNDLEKFMAYVAEDVVFMPIGEPAVRGKAAMRTWMEGFLGQYRTSSLTLANREVFVGNGWATELGTYEWELMPAGGGSPQTDRGNYMQVWRQHSDQTWRFAREVYNSSVPPADATTK